MLISEMILKLKELKILYGDLPCYDWEHSKFENPYHKEAEKIEVEKGCYSYEILDLPERIIIE